MGKVLKFIDYLNEDSFKISSDGTIEKQDYEFYKDHYSEKYKEYKNSSDIENLFESKEIWCLKHKGEKIGIINGDIPEEKIREIVNCLRERENKK